MVLEGVRGSEKPPGAAIAEERRTAGWVSTLSSLFIQRSLFLSVSLVYAYTSDIFEQRISPVNILISVWENKSTSYFTVSFPHGSLQALEEGV